MREEICDKCNRMISSKVYWLGVNSHFCGCPKEPNREYTTDNTTGYMEVPKIT